VSDPSFLAGETLPADKLQDLGEDDIWTPTLTAATANPTLGSGAVTEGDVHFNGRLYVAQFNITAGTGAAAGTGTYQIDLPAGLTIDAGWAANVAVGVAELNNSGTGIAMQIRTSTQTRLVARQCSSDVLWASTNQPLGDNDFIRGTFHALLA